jgi:hypothetical protein
MLGGLYSIIIRIKWSAKVMMVSWSPEVSIALT